MSSVDLPDETDVMNLVSSLDSFGVLFNWCCSVDTVSGDYVTFIRDTIWLDDIYDENYKLRTI